MAAFSSRTRVAGSAFSRQALYFNKNTRKYFVSLYRFCIIGLALGASFSPYAHLILIHMGLDSAGTPLKSLQNISAESMPKTLRVMCQAVASPPGILFWLNSDQDFR